jgi:sugar lactone lactonase YvrE
MMLRTLLNGILAESRPATPGPRTLARTNVALAALAVLAVSLAGNAQTTYTISTIAGTGTAGYSGDGGPAAQAKINYPQGMAVDSAGDLFFADSGNNCIRKISAAGTMSTVAGQCTTMTADGVLTTYDGYSGDGGKATSAELSYPTGVAVDSAGNLYIADTNNYSVRKVTTDGKIATFAGSHVNGYSGDIITGDTTDTFLATAAELGSPVSIVLDAAGNVYICDMQTSVVREVLESNLYITTFAGSDANTFGGGDGFGAVWATFQHPESIAIDKSGNIYIADTEDNEVRKIAAGGQNIVTTIAGWHQEAGFSDTGYGPSSLLQNPTGVAADAAGNVYIVDSTNCLIRMVKPDGTMTTIAGTGAAASSGDGGPALEASLFFPMTIALGNNGQIYITEPQPANTTLTGGKIRVLTPVTPTTGATSKQPVLGRRPPEVIESPVTRQVVAPSHIVQQ